MFNPEVIRNFSIIAHIDHGKSTLADRLLDESGLVNDRNRKDQILDTMDLERERGITIKSNTVTLDYKAQDGKTYILNLIDTPGHVDFSYEVSRSLAACEGVLLLVDASQGVEAQTVANLYLAMEGDLRIIPVINKIDLPSADIPRIKKQIDKSLGLDPEGSVLVSAKEGTGIKELIQAIIDYIPAPQTFPDQPLRALIYDSQYDPFVGAIVKVRIKEGKLKKGDTIRFFSNGKSFEVLEVGLFRLQREPIATLYSGQVGYFIAGIKTVSDTRIGDTVTTINNPAKEPLKGYQDVKPMVFSGIFPIYGEDFEKLSDAMEKLKLNDAALQFEKETSHALGFGFRCGFLGLLHLEIIQERLSREFDLALIPTTPNVEYRVVPIKNEPYFIKNPMNLPDPTQVQSIEEPFISASVITPNEYVGSIMALFTEKRGIHKNMVFIDPETVQLSYEAPLSEVIFDFYDKLKSSTKGYASFDYEFLDYRPSQLVKLDILVNGTPVDALCSIVHKEKAFYRGKELISKLKEIIPKHQFQIPLQAAVGGKILARENISALRKNVTAKCYGGDISRKRKLLEKQKEGKKRMKTFGKVEIPQEAFVKILKI